MKRRNSSVIGDGPRQESLRQWERVLPSSGRHLISSFSSSYIYCYIVCSNSIANKLQLIDSSNTVDEVLKGTVFESSRVRLYLNFIDAAYDGTLKESGVKKTVTLCINRTFFDLLLRKAVRTSALPTAASNTPGDVTKLLLTDSKNDNYCGIYWSPTRTFTGATLNHGCLLLNLIVSGGWLKRLLRKDDGLVCLVPIHEMGRFFDQDFRKHRNLVVPKQRHYQPSSSCCPLSKNDMANGTIKWTSPNWKRRGSNHLSNEPKATVLKSETKDSYEHIDQLGLCDICYLLDFKFHKDRTEVIERALAAGIRNIVILPSSGLDSVEQAIEFCQRPRSPPPKKPIECNQSIELEEDKNKSYSNSDNIPKEIMLTVVAGVHPDDAQMWSSDMSNRLKNLLRSTSICAIGVIGLDFQRMLSSESYQLICFQDQLLMCKNMNLTAVITEKWASEECIGILEKISPPRILIFGFQGSEEQVLKYLQIGAYIGISGEISNVRGKGLRALLRKGVVPLERLVVYSGAPLHNPIGQRREGQAWKRNEPKYLRKICKTVAKCYGCDIDEVYFCMTYNHVFLFRNNEIREIY
jgi:TatD DNase family protein